MADVAEPESVLPPGHDVPPGRYTTVRRLLPQRRRRMAPAPGASTGAETVARSGGAVRGRGRGGTGAGAGTGAGETRLFVLGGEPFGEPLVTWWNFMGRSHEETVRVRWDWAAGRRSGPAPGGEHAVLPAPPMPDVRLKARDRHGRPIG